MAYRKVIFCFLFLFTAAFTMAQGNLSAEKVKELTELHQSIRGTYQIQMKISRLLPAIPLILAQEIEDARSESDTVYLNCSKSYQIMILPAAFIRSEDFIPLKHISGIDRE